MPEDLFFFFRFLIFSFTPFSLYAIYYFEHNHVCKLHKFPFVRTLRTWFTTEGYMRLLSHCQRHSPPILNPCFLVWFKITHSLTFLVQLTIKLLFLEVTEQAFTKMGREKNEKMLFWIQVFKELKPDWHCLCPFLNHFNRISQIWVNIRIGVPSPGE